MKNQFTFLLIALSAFACNKDEVAPTDAPGSNNTTSTYPTSIRAGQDTGVGIDHLDLVPDVNFDISMSILSDSIYVDMNSDLTNDFLLTYHMSDPYMLGYVWNKVDIIPLGGNQICVDPADHSLADSLLFDDIIDNDRTWSDSTAILYHHESSQAGSSSSSGYFKNNHLHYIGVRLNADGNALYGWIYLNNMSLDMLGVTSAYPE